MPGANSNKAPTQDSQTENEDQNHLDDLPSTSSGTDTVLLMDFMRIQ